MKKSVEKAIKRIDIPNAFQKDFQMSTKIKFRHLLGR
jgi:hypothetical protein